MPSKWRWIAGLAQIRFLWCVECNIVLITASREAHLANREYANLHTFHHRNGKEKATKFLIARCKRTGLEGRESVWKEEARQLRH